MRVTDHCFTSSAPRFDPSAPRDSRGRFTTFRCVNAHDRCFGGAGGPCPYCEPKETAQ